MVGRGYFNRVRGICDPDSVLLVSAVVMPGMGPTRYLIARDGDGVVADGLWAIKEVRAGYQPIGEMLCVAGFARSNHIDGSDAASRRPRTLTL